MKFCKTCGIEIFTKDGENYCASCDEAMADGKKVRRALARRERESMLRSLGLVKVRGQLGGVYWE